MSEDWAGLVRRSQDRDLGAEGIPMIVALVDAPDLPAGAPGPDTTPAPGPRLAARLAQARAAVAPSARDADLGVAATLLAAVAFDQAPREQA